ncbi:unnamed protein product [Paramecium pentaurelia]|uniref:non-specific serine/threonine protein kinase n=1 Tax=Paramecium pentaurelia TaxID=43138 RepID=A0A8S1WKR4_9CILI|nr:unnamed protein product [Paramecium pentaurelia]
MQYKSFIDPYLNKQINNQKPYLNSLRSPSFHQPISNSLLCQSISEQKLKLSVDQEIQTKLNNVGQSQWEKIGSKLPKRVQLQYREIIKPKQFEINLSQPRIHSPNLNQRFNRSFYMGLQEINSSSIKRPLLNLTSTVIMIQDSTQATSELQTQKIQQKFRHNFIFHYIIGIGGFGNVWKVESKKTRMIYAMKELKKSKILAKKSVKSVMNEKQLLQKLKNPFIINMVGSFQDKDHLYLILDFLSGGDLRYHILLNKTFREEQIKFFVACIILGLEYINSYQVIHRDLKPENLVLDCKGYLKITDFGIARNYKNENSNETSGTPGYMAPEIILKQNYNYCVDYYAIGVICYEMITGKRPYLGRTKKEIRDEMLGKQIQLNFKEHLQYSFNLIEFTNKLLIRKQQNRLGYQNGIKELKNHKLFQQFQWDKLINKTMIAPYQPKQEDKTRPCQKTSDSQQTIFNEKLKQLKFKEIQMLFDGYTYLSEDKII